MQQIVMPHVEKYLENSCCFQICISVNVKAKALTYNLINRVTWTLNIKMNQD